MKKVIGSILFVVKAILIALVVVVFLAGLWVKVSGAVLDTPTMILLICMDVSALLFFSALFSFLYITLAQVEGVLGKGTVWIQVKREYQSKRFKTMGLFPDDETVLQDIGRQRSILSRLLTFFLIVFVSFSITCACFSPDFTMRILTVALSAVLILYGFLLARTPYKQIEILFKERRETGFSPSVVALQKKMGDAVLRLFNAIYHTKQLLEQNPTVSLVARQITNDMEENLRRLLELGETLSTLLKQELPSNALEGVRQAAQIEIKRAESLLKKAERIEQRDITREP